MTPPPAGRHILAALVMSLCVLAMVQTIYRMKSEIGLRVLMETLGQATLTIFVAHTIFSAFLRVVLLKAGIDQLPVVCVTLIGIFGPLMLLRVSDRLGMSRLAGLK